MKKRKGIYGILLIGVLMLCACGGRTNTKANEEKNQVTPAPEQGEEENKEKEVEMKESPTPAPTPTPNPRSAYTVVIDAGHQKKGNSETEPVGPGAKERKPKVSSGTVGVSTKTPEYKVNLAVAKKLQKELEKKGYQVVMIRTTHDVNISNKERAKIANKSGDVFIRLHCDSVTNSTTSGVLCVCPTANNPYPIGKQFSECEELSYAILSRVCDKTGAKNRGVMKTDYMSGINYCKIPVTIVEMGCMSNPEEDKKLGQKDYQEKIAVGISKGIDDYLGITKLLRKNKKKNKK